MFWLAAVNAVLVVVAVAVVVVFVIVVVVVVVDVIVVVVNFCLEGRHFFSRQYSLANEAIYFFQTSDSGGFRFFMYLKVFFGPSINKGLHLIVNHIGPPNLTIMFTRCLSSINGSSLET